MIMQWFAISILDRGFTVVIGTAEITRVELITVRRMTGYTRITVAAVTVCQNHVITDGNVFYLRADGFNNTGTFVAENRRQRYRVILITDDHVSVTHTGGDNFHQHFIIFWGTDTGTF